MTAANRAMVGAKLKSLFEEQAKKRQQAAGGDKKSYKTSVTQEVKSVSANLRSDNNGKSAEKAAETVNVSTRSVEAATKVIKNGSPELVRAVEQGKIAVSTAAAITQLPKDEQKRVSVTREVKSVVQNSAPWRFRQEFYRIGGNPARKYSEMDSWKISRELDDTKILRKRRCLQNVQTLERNYQS